MDNYEFLVEKLILYDKIYKHCHLSMNFELDIPSDFCDAIDGSNPNFIGLKRFLGNYEIAKNDNTTIANFISTDHQYRKRFYVPPQAIQTLMHHLNDCYKQQFMMHFMEVPNNENPTDHSVGSGLILNFSFVSDNVRVAFNDIMNKFCEILFSEIFLKVLKFAKRRPKNNNVNWLASEVHYCILLGTHVGTYIDHDRKYKQNFSVLFPSIQVSMSLKTFIFDRMIHHCEALHDLFLKHFGITIKDSLVYSAKNTPQYLIGNCSTRSNVFLEPITAHKILIEHCVSKTKETYSSASWGGISQLPNLNGFNNLVYDCSINFEMPKNESGIITKVVFKPNKRVEEAIEAHLTTQAIIMSHAYDKALMEIELKSIYDDSYEHIRSTLNLISDKRLSQENSIENIIAALASVPNDIYKCIGLWFFHDRSGPEPKLEDFERLWGKYSGKTDIQMDIKLIRYWASVDTPSKLARLLNETVRKMMLRDIKNEITAGAICHSHVSEYLKYMFQNSYVCSNVARQIQWYEFITRDSSNYEEGQLFKWKAVGNHPAGLVNYIGSQLNETVERVLIELKNEIIHTKSEDRKKYLNKLQRTFTSSIKSIYDITFKRKVIDDASFKFVNDKIIKDMDKTKHIMGVGNGVLEFDGPNVKLIDYFHSYPISMFTATKYMKYDPENEYIKTVYRMLHSLFPENELDAFDFIMYYFSTSLDWLPKESLFLIITGQGCHAIDTPIRMANGSIKLVQDIDIGDSIMGDDFTPRTVKELFRGQDDMVLIEPVDTEPFTVNKNHILSLVFLDDVHVSDNVITWFERDAEGVPNQYVHSFSSKSGLELFRSKLIKHNQNVIRLGDIIDIKVTDLMSWPKWITIQGYVGLYKHHGSMDNLSVYPKFYMTFIGEGDYYGFELDGNHRYLTGDDMVHHNSNGKSILVEFFRETLGEQYARRMPLSFITEQSRTRSAAADPAMMEMKNARFVNYSESDRNERANIARIKELTGGDTMSGRQLYGEQENFKPNCNHLLATNHHLRIESTEHAVWRRFLTYRFKMTFKENPDPSNPFERKKDPKFINMLKEEPIYKAAFLSILTHYRSKLYEEYDGQILRVPHPTIKEETNVYRQQEDIYERFIMQKAMYKKGRHPQTLDEFMSVFRNFYKSENLESIRIKCEDLQYLFLNSSLQPYLKMGSNGLYVIEDVYVAENMPCIDGSIRFSDYLKNLKKK